MWGKAIAALVLVLGGAAVAAAQVRVGPEFQVNSYTTGNQRYPLVSADDGGNFVIVWQHADEAGTSSIVGQRFDRTGARRGSEFTVNTTTSDAYRGAVAMDSSGGFVIAWQAEGQDGSEFGIFARRFDASGVPIGAGEFRVNSYTTSDQTRPLVAHSSGSGFVIVWLSRGQDGSEFGVFARRYDPAGAPIGSEFQVNAYTTASQGAQDVAIAPDGSFVVVWTSQQDVIARRFDAGGVALASEFIVNVYTTSTQTSAGVAMDASGQFVVVWQSTGQDQSETAVIGQRFDAAGNRLGGEFFVNTYTSGSQRQPAVAREGSGEFVVTWTSPQDGDGDAIVAQRFRADGARVGNEILVNLNTSAAQTNPTVASLGAEKFVIVWEDSGHNDGTATDIFAQPFGDFLFRDGFEAGDTSRWSSNATDGGDLDVTVDAAMKFTSFGLRAFADDTNGLYVQDDTPEDETAYSARFYFHPGDFDPGEALDHRRVRVFIGFEEEPTRRVFALILRRLGGEYALMGRVRLDDDTQYNTGFFPIAAEPHFVEFRWARATAPGNANGSFSLRVDGTLLSSTRTLVNSISTLDHVRMGALSVKTGALGTLYFDEFESRRGSTIGP